MPVASNQPIDWSVLGRAAQHYEARGYTYIEVPWLVRHEATSVTRPGGAENFSAPHGDLVGSAEQSFIQLMLEGELPPGRYYTISPCFRDEPVLDDLHQKHFMKLELIDTLHVERYWTYVKDEQGHRRRGPNTQVDISICAETTMSTLMTDAQDFLMKELTRKGPVPHSDRFDVEYPPDGGDFRNQQQDLMTLSEGWELGSYGIRHHGDLTWVYGTGCAEPRWSLWLNNRYAKDAAIMAESPWLGPDQIDDGSSYWTNADDSLLD